MKDINTKKVFGLSIIFTTLIFVAGIFAGFGLDKLRTTDVFSDLQESELKAQSFAIEQEFLEKISDYDCDLATGRLSLMSKELGTLGNNLISYEKNSLFKKDDYDYLVRKYFLQEIRTYTLFEELKKKCNLDNDLILFFFDPEDDVSARQGNVLDVLVETNQNVSVFALNAKYENDPTLNTAKAYYNISVTPTLIINDKIKKEGLIGKEEIMEMLE